MKGLILQPDLTHRKVCCLPRAPREMFLQNSLAQYGPLVIIHLDFFHVSSSEIAKKKEKKSKSSQKELQGLCAIEGSRIWVAFPSSSREQS